MLLLLSFKNVWLSSAGELKLLLLKEKINKHACVHATPVITCYGNFPKSTFQIRLVAEFVISYANIINKQGKPFGRFYAVTYSEHGDELGNHSKSECKNTLCHSSVIVSRCPNIILVYYITIYMDVFFCCLSEIQRSALCISV